MPDWTIAVTIVFAALGSAAVLAPFWIQARAKRAANPPPARIRREKPPPPAVALSCPVCQAEVAFATTDLRPLSPPEVALIVSQRSEAFRRSLSEAQCPRCEACLTFFADRKPPTLLGANIYVAHRKSNRCADCSKPLTRPPWDRESIPTRSQAPGLLESEYGLECEHCGAVCCVTCCEDVSRNRSTDDTLMCPRCRRRSMEKLHYF